MIHGMSRRVEVPLTNVILTLNETGSRYRSERRLAGGGGNASVPARRPGRRIGLDGAGDDLRGLRFDNDVPAEQNAADDLPGMRG